MTMIITDDCINCGACAVECPPEAIYEPAKSFKLNRKIIKPFSYEHFFIVTKICDECFGLKKIKCIAVCPMDAIKKIKKRR